MMTMFSLYELMDKDKVYQKACMEIVSKRFWALIDGLGLEVGQNANYDAYYGLIGWILGPHCSARLEDQLQAPEERRGGGGAVWPISA